MARACGEKTLSRVLAWLGGHPRATAAEVATACHVVVRHAQLLLRYCHAAGWVHYPAWRKSINQPGHLPVRLWCLGLGRDADRPPPDTAVQVRQRRKARLQRQFGRSLAHKIMSSRRSGGAAVLCVDGEVVYRRGKPRGQRVARAD